MQNQAAGSSGPIEADAQQLSETPDSGSAAIVAMEPDASGLQCPSCRRVLCGPDRFCFFTRYDKQTGFETHLMLKPDLSQPDTFDPADQPEQGAILTLKCLCGEKLGDTRRVGPNKAPMTAFKSGSVRLFDRHHPGKKSKWPPLYQQWPYNQIEVRERDNFFGAADGGCVH